MHLTGERFRRFFGCDANCFAGVHIYECCCNFSPVAELESTFSEAATGDHGNGVGGAAVDFDEGDKPLPIFLIAARIVDAEFRQTEHCQSYPQNLSGAKMPVGLLGIAKIFIEGIHRSFQPSAVSLTPLNYFLLQRTPSFVFSMSMPAAVSSARRASETLKLRPRRAASISAILFSMSVSES